MTSTEIITELHPIFADVFDIPDVRITPATKASDIEGWDSLTHINLVVAIEHKYRVKFALGELQDLKNVGDMADLIVRKLQK
jgi:acyl carrier protein